VILKLCILSLRTVVCLVLIIQLFDSVRTELMTASLNELYLRK